MTWSIGLHWGHSFLDFCAAQDRRFHYDRLALSQQGLGQTLTHALEKHQIDRISEIKLSTSWAQSFLDHLRGRPPAFLTTSGLENWLEMNLKIEPDFFSVRTRRSPFLLNPDLVFGLRERTTASGQIETPIDESEIEFIARKLELSSVRNVAIGFLHSARNPDNERRTAEKLRQFGFEVSISSDFACDGSEDEKSRWWSAIVQRYLQPEWKTLVVDNLGSLKVQWAKSPNLKVATNQGWLTIDDPNAAMGSLGGPAWLLSQRAPDRRKKVPTSTIYAGLEGIWVFRPDVPQQKHWPTAWGQITLDAPAVERFTLQPTHTLGQQFCGEPSFAGPDVGYDPGPMIFGRGPSPTVLDILAYTGVLGEIPGFTERTQEKGRLRLKETLGLIGQSSADARLHLSPSDLAEALQATVVCGWAFELHRLEARAGTLVCGPLAATMARLLGSTFPEVIFNVDAGWCLSAEGKN